MGCECDHYESVTLDDFLPYVLPGVEGLPVEIAAHNIRLSAIEFARCTGLSERTLFIDAFEGVGDYWIELPDCYSMVTIRQVCVNGREATAARSMDHCFGGCQYYFEKPDRLYITAPGCDLPRGIEVVMKVAPGEDSCTIDRCMYDLHAETIAQGALRRIFLMKNAPWFDMALSRENARYFSAGVARGSILRHKQHSSAPMSMKLGRSRRFV
jgi:hypothetical protein